MEESDLIPDQPETRFDSASVLEATHPDTEPSKENSETTTSKEGEENLKLQYVLLITVST